MTKTNFPASYSDFSNEQAIKIYEVIALLNAIDSLASNDDEGQSNQVLIDLCFLAKGARRILHQVAGDMDVSSLKYDNSPKGPIKGPCLVAEIGR